MGFFTKKPVTIEAERWVSLPIKKGGVIEEGMDKGLIFAKDDGTLKIITLEGDHIAHQGDWIIKGIKGEYYPCKPDIFEATYEIHGDSRDTVPYENEREAICRARVLVQRQCPRSREQSLVLTKLDEALMWMSQMPVEKEDEPIWKQAGGN